MGVLGTLRLRLRCLRKGHRYYPGRVRDGTVTEVCDYCHHRRRRPAPPEREVARRQPLPEASVQAGELVDASGLGQVLALDPDEAESLALEPTFPAPAVRISGALRLWLRADVEAFAAGQPVERQENALRGDYLTGREVAELTGVAAGSAEAADLPAPAIDVRSTRLWRRADIEVWRASNGSRG